MAVAQTDMSTVLSGITTQWGTVNSTTSADSTSGTKAKRSGQDGSTGSWVDTNSFTEFVEDFAEGFNAGYQACINLNLAPMDSLLNPDTTVDNRIQCPDCGISAYITLYGGYDWNWGSAKFNYIHAGFRVQDASLNVAFQIFGIAGYEMSKQVGLDRIKLPGINIGGLLNVNPVVSLQAEVDFKLVNGGFNVKELGVGWTSTEDLWLSVDFLNWQTSSSGWDQNMAPHFLHPVIESIPSELSLRGSIGPVFGIELQALGKHVQISAFESC